MGTINKSDDTLNRLVSLLVSKNPPWVEYLNEAIEILREEIREEISIALQACRDNILEGVLEEVRGQVKEELKKAEEPVDIE